MVKWNVGVWILGLVLAIALVACGGEKSGPSAAASEGAEKAPSLKKLPDAMVGTWKGKQGGTLTVNSKGRARFALTKDLACLGAVSVDQGAQVMGMKYDEGANKACSGGVLPYKLTADKLVWGQEFSRVDARNDMSI